MYHAADIHPEQAHATRTWFYHFIRVRTGGTASRGGGLRGLLLSEQGRRISDPSSLLLFVRHAFSVRRRLQRKKLSFTKRPVRIFRAVFFCCAGKAKDRTGRQQAGMCQQQTLAGLMLLCALYRRRACAPGAAAHIRLRRTKRVMCAANTRLMPAYRFRPPLHVSFVCFSSPRAY